MKKKPPPGATLIARLKEQRLAREAELALRQEGGADAPAKPADDNDAAANDAKAQAAAAKPVTPLAARQEPQPAAAKESANAADKPAASESAKPATDKNDQRTVRAVENTIVVESVPEMKPMVVAGASPRDLIHRHIDFDDLRPTSDDYFILTDEIRLAGRFAAVGLIAQGLRLFRLREAEIYKNHYVTFEEYCRKEHQMSATYAYRLMRMAEMAEQVARIGQPMQTGSQHMPDPFEVMIGLGHRHIMALLPLEAETAQELLVRGIPLSGDASADERLPIGKATEKQIREALRAMVPGAPAKAAVVPATEKRALVSEKQLIPALSKLVEMLEDWSVWLDGDPPAELEAARMGRGQLLGRLAKRFRSASGKIADALEGDEQS
jgi:hypothetical protein